MKIVTLILGLSVLAVQTILPVQAENSVNKTWLVMGDSLSAAYGIERAQGWVALLQQKRPELKIINASISGETTSGGLQRLPSLISKYQPSLLILELGANDALRGQNLAKTKKNLESMIQLCEHASFPCQTVLLGIRLPTNYGPAYDRFLQKIYKDLAEKYELAFDPFFLETVALDPDLMQSDGLHPNADAQPKILQRLQSVLPKK
jgi:acyl-CoA thioesterase-1